MISFPSSAHTREITNAIRLAIGRNVIFNTEVITECVASGCGLNPITQTSINAFCPICSGTYFIETYSGVSILAHISHGKEDITQWYPGGTHFDGDVRIQIEHTVTNLDIIAKTDHVIADGTKYEIKKTIPRGFPDLNRLLLDCKEVEKL